MFARWGALAMNSWLMQLSHAPLPHSPTFSPVWLEPRRQPRSCVTPDPWKMVPAFAIACAWLWAMAARQLLQLRPLSPAAPRSPLISACCADPTTRGRVVATPGLADGCWGSGGDHVRCALCSPLATAAALGLGMGAD